MFLHHHHKDEELAMDLDRSQLGKTSRQPVKHQGG
jgi:hypothetical protein